MRNARAGLKYRQNTIVYKPNPFNRVSKGFT
jgi:hypothetical protein